MYLIVEQNCSATIATLCCRLPTRQGRTVIDTLLIEIDLRRVTTAFELRKHDAFLLRA